MVLQNSGRYVANSADNDTGGVDSKSDLRLRDIRDAEAIDSKYGFSRLEGAREETGYLLNMHATEVLDDDKRLVAAVDYYFVQEDGSRFKVAVPYSPYLYVSVRQEFMQETSAFISKKFSSFITTMQQVAKEDLDLPNHLVGLKQVYLKLSFLNMTDMQKVRKDILAAVRRNRERSKTSTAYTEMLAEAMEAARSGGDDKGASSSSAAKSNPMNNLVDIREYDLPLHVRYVFLVIVDLS